VSTADRKRELRESVLAQRDALSGEEVERRSAEIARRVMALECYGAAGTRLLFASFGSEVRTEALLEETLASEARLVLPRVESGWKPDLRTTMNGIRGRAGLALHEVRDIEADLAPGTWGIREPVPRRCPEVPLGEVDFILVPGVAFDRRGGRLGYGGGFYDHILRVRTGLVEAGAAVAVGFALQIVDQVPRDERDVLVPVIVTETEIIRTST
jgi:5-formyltetrahydrofolate cyclo-ligase